MGRPNRRGRDIDGIILLDKPFGISSNTLLQTVKRLFRVNRAGHTGSLDPLATGMLPVCFGEATKFSQYLLNANKRYMVTAMLGKRTDTSDAEGRTVSCRPVFIDQSRLEAALDQFRGKSKQLPSIFSALKHHGRPLYEYARKGITVAREARNIHVYDLHLHYWDHTQVELEIHCAKGTYIRTIIDDLGELLGCGAYVAALRRLAVASYSTDRMVTLATLQNITGEAPEAPETMARLDALLLPIDSAMADIPVVNLLSDIAARVRLGQSVAVTKQLKVGMVRLTEGDTGRFFGIGEISTPGRLKPIRLIATSRIK